MWIVHVHVSVLPGCAEAFMEATRVNSEASLREPGVLRFDVLRDEASPDKFVLVEVYRDADAPAAHKKTAHYAAWRDAVEAMMAEPRRGVRYAAVTPLDASGWRSFG